MIKIAPSILSADFSCMADELKKIASADLIHCDVMDGRFVPNITFGMKMIADIKKHTKIPLDVHLMIENPENYIQEFIAAGADYLTFHIEASKRAAHTKEMLTLIKSKGIFAGLAVSPDTSENTLEPFIELCDLIVVMSVYPGFGGQTLIPSSLQKIQNLKNVIRNKNKACLIEVDGGITLENAGSVIESGADILVAGNTVYKSDDPGATIKLLRNQKT